MVEIGNDKSNAFWEQHYTGSGLPSDVEQEIRENFTHAKYVTRSWVPRTAIAAEGKDTLGHLLCQNVSTDNLMRTIELIALGANVSSVPSLLFLLCSR